MATAATTGKARCVTCGKEKTAYKCEGCSKRFCFDHLTDHRQALGKQLDEIENERNLFQQTLSEQKNNPQQHSLMQQIDTWERESIHKIRETADEARSLLVICTTGHINAIETELIRLTEQIKETRHENDVNEIILNELKQTLTRLGEQLVKPSDVAIQHDSSSFVTKISVVTSSSSGKQID